MKSEKDFIKWIEKQIELYRPILGLNIFEIKTQPYEKDYLAMSCKYPYLNGEVLYSKEALKEWQDGKLNKNRVLHELCHLITDPLYCKAVERYASKNEIEDERERLTDKISYIVDRLLK